MNKLLVNLLMLLALVPIAQAQSIDFESNKLIYGHDDRYEVDDYSDHDFILKSQSVAMRVSNRKLSEDREDSNFLNFPKRKLQKTIPQICSTERFVEQVSVGDCSAFLIAPNKLVTAGHCMMDQSACSSNKWVFDYKLGTTHFNKKDVYSCKNIISQRYVYNEKEVSDYAVIELDRNVLDRNPLEFRINGTVKINTPLLVIGHPMGLPMKITDGGSVSKMNDKELVSRFHSWLLKKNYFTANLDTYAGNSGSPVFNKETGKVEGILVKGADDFVFNKDTLCLESVHLSDSHLNTYEKVMRITKVPGL